MALVKCPECGREVSDSAETCPSCGHPIKQGDPDQARRASFRSGAIMGLIGALSFLLLTVLLTTGSFNKPSEGTADVSVSVESGQNPALAVAGYFAVVGVTVLFLVALLFAKRLKKRPAIVLSACALAISIVGMLGIFFFFGMLALCGGWLFMWQPVLEVIGAYKMLSSAMKYEG